LSITNYAWLSKLKNHLEAEHYGVGSVNQYMGVARRFLADLERQHLSIDTVQPANIERYLQKAPWMYPDRHEHSPDYRHWRRTSIHMLLRVAQGQWPLAWRFHETFTSIASSPRAGVNMPDLPPGDVRKFPMGNYLIYYRALPGRIVIARVLHGKRLQGTAFRRKM
jgi:hypothetical protein